MSNGGPVVFVVDDNLSVRKGLESLIRSADHGEIDDSTVYSGSN
jgi:hypothetical protein